LPEASWNGVWSGFVRTAWVYHLLSVFIVGLASDIVMGIDERLGFGL